MNILKSFNCLMLHRKSVYIMFYFLQEIASFFAGNITFMNIKFDLYKKQHLLYTVIFCHSYILSADYSK